VTKFPVASDFHPKGEIAAKYGVYNEERGVARRCVFIIDENGVLRWSKIYTEGIPDNEELLAELDKL
jgi:alkyl hydroperoxide reductase subunit AhpC